MKHALLAFLTVLALVLPAASIAQARCRIRNTTGKSLTLSSGNVSNQRVGGNTTTSIAHGQITGRSDDGSTVGGYCEDGQEVEVREVNGVLVIAPR